MSNARLKQIQRVVGVGQRVIESPTQTPIGNQMLSALKPKRIEICSTGIDEALQGIGSDPWGSQSWTGLRIPTHPTPPASPHLRYLFNLCSFSMSDGDTARIVGMRNGWTLGFLQSARAVEQWVTNPFFKGNDFNISWHLRKLTFNETRRPNPGQVIPVNALSALQNFAFQASNTPALLWTPPTVAAAGNPYYTALTSYTPPNRGRPYGRPLAGELGTFHDLKVRWDDADVWHSLDIPLVGPCRVVFYASVQQSNPQSRQVLVPPQPFLYQNGLSDEEQFLQNFPGAIPWRVAAALAVEIEDISPANGMFRNYVMDGGK